LKDEQKYEAICKSHWTKKKKANATKETTDVLDHNLRFWFLIFVHIVELIFHIDVYYGGSGSHSIYIK
jgi:hypothetical protein